SFYDLLQGQRITRLTLHNAWRQQQRPHQLLHLYLPRAIRRAILFILDAATLLQRSIEFLLLLGRQDLLDFVVHLLAELLELRLELAPHRFCFGIATIENRLDLRALIVRQTKLLRELVVEQQTTRTTAH